MENRPEKEKGPSFEEINKISMARRKVADILGYKDAQEMFRKGLTALKIEILRKLKDLKKTSDLLEEDEEEDDKYEYSGETNKKFQKLYFNAVAAKLIEQGELDTIYPPVPEEEN